MSDTRFEFFFDCSSPWTYLAFENVQPIALRHEVEIEWRPILVGGIFNTVNASVYESRANPVPIKARYYQKDLADWARYTGIAIGSPTVFPVNSVRAMRGAFVALEHECLVPYAREVFRAYWGELRDISQEDTLSEILAAVELDSVEYFQKINDRSYKDKLRANTDELIERGGFGSPTIFVDGEDMYFGNDRLPLVDARLDRN
ncbi:MAG: 2-hydroxychromene-2-carboxylate isomerase [Gammaproteobacteria bacterium]|nr:2-hydroxychromene-2-carboxylate isomerase [Gammaproteobacteria bacterium]